ncbi:MAG: galactokinase, partial [Phycisphaerales bacterium]|nr:galactokinase [Phycisphaerales bacterium]
MTLDDIKRVFEEKTGKAPEGIVTAPGRVNLIGEHTDYNGGFVLPMAIDKKTIVAWARRDDNILNLIPEEPDDIYTTIDLDQPVEKTEVKWANYVRGVIWGMQQKNVPMSGMDLMYVSTVPIGSGLSSSAALEMSTAMAVLQAAGQTMDRYEMALLCQKAEHDFAGTPCGIMDQAISALGQDGHALLLDCVSGDQTLIPFDCSHAKLLVCDTKVKHALNDGGYAARRDQCYSAAEKLGVKLLREATADQVDAVVASDDYTDKEKMRVRHVVGEIQRTVDAVKVLEQNDFDAFGKLMFGSHNSLRDDYEVSCVELDKI